MATLSVNDLSIKFGGIKALTNVSLEVPENSFVGLMGPNGAGKTTVINCISRIYSPEKGQITFDGQDLLKLSGDKILGLGISRTFQDLSFFGRISDMMIIDYMKLGQFDAGQTSLIPDGLQTKRSKEHERHLHKRARRVLEFFRDVRNSLEPSQKERGYPYLYGREGFPDLLDLEYKPIGVLSFAWRRRLDLARALVSNPRLLLLDEPAQGLPPSEIENLGKTLKIIQAELGVSALIVEHNVTTLAQISDKMVVMCYGEKIAEGPPDVVTRDPQVIELYLGSKKKDQPESGPKTPVVQSVPDTVAAEIPLLELKDIDHYYGLVQTLFSISLKIRPQQITTILGSNGSGKSTLLRVISGTEKPNFGEVIFKGNSMPLGWPEIAAERGIQYVPQGHVIFPELTVLDNLKIGAYLNKKKNLKFDMSLDVVLHYFPDLKTAFKEQAASLSGGQQQMLAIAQALMGKPDLLLLDEPSLGLSPMFVERLFEIIKKISLEQKCAIVLVEQDVNRALDVSDYVYMLSSGLLIAQGSPKQLDNSLIQKYLGFN